MCQLSTKICMCFLIFSTSTYTTPNPNSPEYTNKSQVLKKSIQLTKKAKSQTVTHQILIIFLLLVLSRTDLGRIRSSCRTASAYEIERHDSLPPLPIEVKGRG
ncbi:hypothetical protein V6Z12_A05G296600 [Gossypium hirsutum]